MIRPELKLDRLPSIRFVDDQAGVMRATEPHIMVSASAGTGKTFVMTHHIAYAIANGDLEVDRLVVLTFTREAAAQMRDKIEDVLHQLLKVSDDEEVRRRLQNSMDHLSTARISTIDAFFVDLLRQFAWDLVDDQGEPILDGGDRMLDEDEADLLLISAVETVLEDAYRYSGTLQEPLLEAAESDASSIEAPWEAYDDRDFQALMSAYAPGRGDDDLYRLIQYLYSSLRSMPYYRQFWCETLDRLGEEIAAFPEGSQGDILLRHYHVRLDEALKHQRACYELYLGERDTLYGAKSKAQLEASQRGFDFCFDALQELSKLRDRWIQKELSNSSYWMALRSFAERLPDLKVPSGGASKPDREAFLNAFGTFIHPVFTCFNPELESKKLRDAHILPILPLFHLPLEEAREQMQLMVGPLQQLKQLLLTIDDAYSQAKRDLIAMDFGDDAHFALALLERPAVQAHLKQTVDAIYIDEYQDTSALQEAILSGIEAPLSFRVGDVKQSIYRFRHARPEIMLKRIEEGHIREDAVTLPLNRNRRSTDMILQGINRIFDALMEPSLSGLDYRKDHTLIAAQAEHSDAPKIAFHFFAQNKEQRDPERERQLLDAYANEIGVPYERLLSQLEYDWRSLGTDPAFPELMEVVERIQTLRRDGADYQDICIISRTWTSLKKLEALCELWGVPTETVTKSGAFEAYEIRVLSAWLKLLDNPRQDIPLVTVLLSPLVNDLFTEEDLAIIRQKSRAWSLDTPEYHPDWHLPTPFFIAWEAFADAELEDPSELELQERVKAFNASLSFWRRREMTTNLGDLLDDRLQRSDYFKRLDEPSETHPRQQRIQAFILWARRFDAPMKQGIHALIRQLDKLETHAKTAPWMDLVPPENAVRLMTIHGTKGLSIKHAILINLESPYQFRKSKEAVVLDPDLGVGFRIALQDSTIHMDSFFRKSVELQTQEQDLAQEFNVFYVALTRAGKTLDAYGKLAYKKDGLTSRLEAFLEPRGGADPSLSTLTTLRSNLEATFLALADDSGLRALNLHDTPGYERRHTASDLYEWHLRTSVDADLAYRLKLLERRHGKVLDPTLDSSQALPSESTHAWLKPVGERTILTPSMASELPLKYTVTELKRRRELLTETPNEDQDLHSTDQPLRYGMSLRMEPLIRELEPASKQLRGARRGVVLHSFMQYAPWRELRNAGASMYAYLEAANTMVQAGHLLEHEVPVITDALDALQMFAQSTLLSEILEAEQHGQSYRELPFTLMIPVQNLFPDHAHLHQADQCMVQGMIDLWYIRGDEVILVDYKSDRLSGSSTEISQELHRRYQIQLSLYAQALESALRRPVSSCMIWLIDQGKCYTIERLTLDS